MIKKDRPNLSLLKNYPLYHKGVDLSRDKRVFRTACPADPVHNAPTWNVRRSVTERPSRLGLAETDSSLKLGSCCSGVKDFYTFLINFMLQ